MGLDIYQEHAKTGNEVDYSHFNWTACYDFVSWCQDNGLPNPFPNWNGANDGDTVDLGNPADRQSVRDWLNAYKKLFPDDYALGVGEAMRTLMYRASEANRKKEERFYREEFLDWDRNTAIAWSWFLRGGLRKKSVVRYW
jgi:hypothetical protein